MKFNHSSITVLICISLSIMLISCVNVFSADKYRELSTLDLDSSWLYVGGSGAGNYSSIIAAIENASDGDKIFVFTGTYEGHVSINKSLTLLGENKESTIILGYHAYALTILADDVDFSGFTIRNSAGRGEGVRIDSFNSSFYNNIVDTPSDNTRLSGDNNTLANNSFVGDSIILSGNNNTIHENHITNAVYGVYFTNANDNYISNNSFVNCGLFITDQEEFTNTIINNIVNQKALIFYANTANQTIVESAGQIVLVNCDNFTISQQDISHTTIGIQLWNSKYCTILDSTLSDNKYGIDIHGHNNIVQGNQITDNNFDGIRIQGTDNIILQNIIADNDDGIYQYSAENSHIHTNTISSNINYGLLIAQNSNNNHIENNTITSNTGGIHLSSNANTIASNTITNNRDGILLTNGNNNIITLNQIEENSNGMQLDPQTHSNRIIDNQINYNNKGIILLSASNIISANTIDYNSYGLILNEHKFNNISKNRFFSNTEIGIILHTAEQNQIISNLFSENHYGIYCSNSFNNHILSNNFEQNMRHALFKDSANYWHQNYWGRPHILPKFIFGTRLFEDLLRIPAIEFDLNPQLIPNKNIDFF